MTRLTSIPPNVLLIPIWDGGELLPPRDQHPWPFLNDPGLDPETRGRPAVSAAECTRRREVRDQRLSTGCCTKCGASRPSWDPILCKRCRTRDRAYGRSRWDAHRQRVQAAKAMGHGETGD